MLLLPSFLQQHLSASSTRVILMRHGQSTYNAEKRHQGSSDDSVLTETGRITAYQTGLLLRELEISTIYASPLQRAQETAQEVMAAIATGNDRLPALITHSTLKEISLPLWDGLPYQVVRERFAREYRCWKEHPDQFQMNIHAESVLAQKETIPLANLIKPTYPVLELYDRAQQFWQEIGSRHSGETVLVVSHAGTNRALISTAIALPAERFHSLQQSNCGVSVLHFPNSYEQTAHLELLNFTDHLGEVLPKLKNGKQGLRLLIVPSDEINRDRSQMATRLKTIPIDFSISNDLDHSQSTINQLLQYHPNTIQLQVMREDFPQAWQQMLASRQSHKPSPKAQENRPLTALVVARKKVALQLLSQLLAIHPQCLHLTPDTLNVVHYPLTLNIPVLQAMNIA